LKLRAASQAVFDYLSKLDAATWSQAKATYGRSYFHTTTSNDAESMNAVLLEARQRGPLELLTSLRGWIFGKFSLRREEAEAATDVFVPAVQKLIDEEADVARTFRCVANGKHVSVTVVGSRTFAVDLEKKTCSCGLPKAQQVVCAHILAALSAVGRPRDWHSYIGTYLRWDTQRAIYRANFPAVNTVDLLQASELELSLFSPTGSRRKKRLPSTGEIAQHHVQRDMAGTIVGAAASQEEHATEVTMLHIDGPNFVVQGHRQHTVNVDQRTCDCKAFKEGHVCAHIQAAEKQQAPLMGNAVGFVPSSLFKR